MRLGSQRCPRRIYAQRVSNAAWGPPEQPPGTRGTPAGQGNRALIVILSIGLALLLVATFGVVRWLISPTAPVGSAPAGSVSPSTPAPSVSTSASLPPTSAPRTQPSPRPSSSPNRSDPPVRQPEGQPHGLKKNGLYSINLTSGSAGGCNAKIRRPKPPLKDSALGPYLRQLVDCLVKDFKPPLAAKGFELTTPKVKTYKGSVETPCGRLFSTSNPAYYCSGTIYWPVTSDDGREAYTIARLGYVGLIAHEFGHHLQLTTGILSEYSARYYAADRKGRYALSRRLELQAQCFEGVFLSYEEEWIKLSRRDRAELRLWHSYTGDEDPPSSRKPDHGSSKAQIRWLEKGLANSDFGRCNTWTASAKSVS